MLVRKNSNGFTLIELMVVIVIIGLMATIFVPNLRRQVPEQQRKQFIRSLNTLTQYAWQNAIGAGRPYRVLFDLEKRTVRVEQEVPQGAHETTPSFKAIESYYGTTVLPIDEQFVIKNFYINGSDEMRRGGFATTTVWFFIVPEGLSQEVIINMLDERDNDNGKAYAFSLVLNPFNAQFKQYETFQKP